MMDYCKTCKYSKKLDNKAVWTEEYEKNYQNELEENRKLDKSWTYRREFTFWKNMKDKYLEQENNVECRRFPQYVIRENDDYCGEWKMG